MSSHGTRRTAAQAGTVAAAKLPPRANGTQSISVRIWDEAAPPSRHQPYSIYVIELRGRPGGGDIHSLRAILKTLGRRYHLKCISAREVQR
jgi:hypothetical protein